MAKTIFSEDELSGMIKMLIYSFDLHQKSINELYGLGFNIKKIEKTYNVDFHWQGKTILVSLSTQEFEPEYDRQDYEESFMIREDESLSKLEQFVDDILFMVTETEINNTSI